MLPYELEMENGRLVKAILQSTWQEVGDDATHAMEEAGTELEQDSAIEIILDASRAEGHARTNAEKAALKEFRLLPWNQQCQVANRMLGQLV